MDGAELIGEVAGLAPGLGLKYQRDGKEVYQLWGTGKPVVLEVAATGPVKVTDLMGRTRELLPLDGRIYLLLNTTTVYLSGPVQSVSTSKEVVLREKTPAFFRIPMTLEFQAPADFRLKLRNGEFQPGQVRLPVSEKKSAAPPSQANSAGQADSVDFCFSNLKSLPSLSRKRSGWMQRAIWFCV
ncbi:MAG: hypothetical protein L6W00_03650 [Lentisphaeria bacterium]|nr:MAG: hypothetical protein L6W00_03650 [Lentisphaeria bacterium]